MKPIDRSLKEIPNDFILLKAVHPQLKKPIMSAKAKETASDTSSTLVITNLVAWKLLMGSMSMIFGSIIALQIVAHLPL